MAIYKGNRKVAGTTDISGKANVSLDNLSSAGKSLAARLGMPSGTITTLTLGAYASTYTAPKTGYFSFLVQLKANGYLQLVCNGITERAQNSGTSNGYYTVCLEVKANDIVLLQYGNVEVDAVYNTYRFISSEGDN